MRASFHLTFLSGMVLTIQNSGSIYGIFSILSVLLSFHLSMEALFAMQYSTMSGTSPARLEVSIDLTEPIHIKIYVYTWLVLIGFL